ncbi:MAG: hypothetical protein LBU69_02505 [Deltaproteobacteria bacterium]|jgi:hypothetical protein|nr:hypothetical protein [Deltaproteobacteria bacterium]
MTGFEEYILGPDLLAEHGYYATTNRAAFDAFVDGVPKGHQIWKYSREVGDGLFWLVIYRKAGTGLDQPGAWDEVTMRVDAFEGHLDGVSEVTLSDWDN